MASVVHGNTQRGFSLIELMIVVAMVSILAAIALPSYRDSIRRGHRADARAGLLQAQQWMERAATATGSYPNITALPDALAWNADSSKRYTISLAWDDVNKTAFTLRAAPKTGTGQAGDPCGSYTLKNTGERGLTGGNTLGIPDCWGK
jgi:type IV pilus assembly protein PilE